MTCRFSSIWSYISSNNKIFKIKSDPSSPPASQPVRSLLCCNSEYFTSNNLHQFAFNHYVLGSEEIWNFQENSTSSRIMESRHKNAATILDLTAAVGCGTGWNCYCKGFAGRCWKGGIHLIVILDSSFCCKLGIYMMLA
jgi:hypothetical protein